MTTATSTAEPIDVSFLEAVLRDLEIWPVARHKVGTQEHREQTLAIFEQSLSALIFIQEESSHVDQAAQMVDQTAQDWYASIAAWAEMRFPERAHELHEAVLNALSKKRRDPEDPTHHPGHGVTENCPAHYSVQACALFEERKAKVTVERDAMGLHWEAAPKTQDYYASLLGQIALPVQPQSPNFLLDHCTAHIQAHGIRGGTTTLTLTHELESTTSLQAFIPLLEAMVGHELPHRTSQQEGREILTINLTQADWQAIDATLQNFAAMEQARTTAREAAIS